MKVKKVVEIKTHYSFEAPIIPAAMRAGGATNNSVGDDVLDLNSFLAPIPKNIFLVRVSGESMVDENIRDGDILVVDRNEQPQSGKIVIAALNGEMAVKTYVVKDGTIYLVSANKKFFPIEIQGLMEFKVQGIVKHVIRKV